MAKTRRPVGRVDSIETIREMLKDAGDNERAGASAAAIAELEARLAVRLPDDHKAFLRWSNGWEGEFGETWLVLDDIKSILDANDEGFRKDFPGYVAIGGNGGLETYAFDFRQGDHPPAVVAIDRISGDEEDIWPVAPSLTASLARLLIDPRLSPEP